MRGWLFLACCFVLAAGSLHAEETMDLKRTAELIVQQTNAFRQEKDLDKLTSNQELQQAAQKFAEFMARTDQYGHHADDRTPAQRAEAAGYEYCVIRENIAFRTDSREMDAQVLADFFTQGWIDSPEHRENMLAEFISETGVAVASQDQVTFYGVQLFGRPKSAAYQITVTNKTQQTLTLQIESNGGSDEVELQPRVRLKMTRCFPTQLKLADQAATRELKESSSLHLVQNADGEVEFQTE